MGAMQLTQDTSHEPREMSPAEAGIHEALEKQDWRGALALCSRGYGAMLGRFCMALIGSQQDAEDICQEVLLDAYAGFAGFRAEGSVKAWLFTIARRKCARCLEKRRRRAGRLHLVHDAERSPDSSGTEAQLLKRQRASQARNALATMRPSEREALLLRFGAQLSFEELGRSFEIAPPAARKRVSRAIASLRAALAETENAQENQGGRA